MKHATWSILGSPETVAATIARIAGQLDRSGLALTFKLGAMPYDMTLFNREGMPRIRHLLTREAVA